MIGAGIGIGIGIGVVRKLSEDRPRRRKVKRTRRQGVFGDW
jgi:hypothetical protein